MPSQFDDLADLYANLASWEFRREIEIPAVLEALGELRGLNVLDFGCGEGTYARMLKERGARRVVGFDSAAGMLARARARERDQPAGVEFVAELGDAFDRQFDLVLGVYVLPYAASYRTLEQMCANMSRLLRPGGRLVTLPIHPDYHPDPAYYVPYGFSLTAAEPHADGGVVRLDLFHAEFRATVTAWYWSAASLERALHQAGFKHVGYKNPRPARFPELEEAPESLRAYLRRPHAVILDCRAED
jgi:toxoflavin synthase